MLTDWLREHTYPPRWLPPRWHHPVIGYLVAVFLALVAAGLTLLLEIVFPPLVWQGTLLAVVIVLVALNWGEGPSLLVTIIGALLLAFVALPPHFSWEIDDRSEAMGFLLFVVTGVVMNLIASQAGRARRKSEQLAREAEGACQNAEQLADLLSQAHAQSEQERQYLQQVLDVLPVGVYIVDAQGHLLQMNAAMRTLWDRETPPVGKSVRSLGTGWWPTPSTSASEQEGILTHTLSRGEVVPGREVEIETIARQRKTILCSAAPLRDEHGGIVGGVVAETDITERKRLEEGLRAANQQMDTFLAIASHELKTPLTILKLQMQMTLRRLQYLTIPPKAETMADWANHLPPAQEALTRMNQQVGRLDRLVNDLLEVSRIRAGKLDLRLESLDLVALMRQAVEDQRVASSRTIRLHLPASLPEPVVADAERIEQVLTNYLSNALKYSPAEAPVDVGLEVDEQQIRVWVHDAGPGIPSAEQEHIWERFHRASGIKVQSGSGVGLGLGLSICREIIERHDGQVGVQSAPGEGSTFWFTLPLTPQKRNT
jgi:signal transduction histidine kinase